MYLFQVTPIVDSIPSSMDKKVSKDMVMMWTNFAKTGDPNGNTGEMLWYSAGPEEDLDNEYFIIDEELRMAHLEDLDRFKMWR